MRLHGLIKMMNNVSKMGRIPKRFVFMAPVGPNSEYVPVEGRFQIKNPDWDWGWSTIHSFSQKGLKAEYLYDDLTISDDDEEKINGSQFDNRRIRIKTRHGKFRPIKYTIESGSKKHKKMTVKIFCK